MKTQHTKFLFILTLATLFFACGRTHTPEEIDSSESISFLISEDTDASAFVDSIVYLPLIESENHIIPEISKVCTTTNKIAIGSKEYGKLCVYNSDGDFLFEINKKGHGEGEYLEIANFTITDSIIYILDNYSHSIHKYSSIDGKYLSSNRISFIAWDIEAFNDESFLFTMIPNNPEANFDIDQTLNCAVWETNGKWEVQKTFIPIQNGYYEMYGKSRYFTKNENKIIFHMLNGNGYYVFENNRLPKFVKLQFDNPLPDTFSGNLEDANKLKYDYVSETPFVCDNWTIMRITHDGYEEQYLRDVKTNQFVLNSTTTAKNGLLNIIGIKNGSPIGIIPDYETYSILIDNDFTKADHRSEDLLKKGGITLVKYIM